jgi:hypothetical protein
MRSKRLDILLAFDHKNDRVFKHFGKMK